MQEELEIIRQYQETVTEHVEARYSEEEKADAQIKKDESLDDYINRNKRALSERGHENSGDFLDFFATVVAIESSMSRFQVPSIDERLTLAEKARIQHSILLKYEKKVINQSTDELTAWVIKGMSFFSKFMPPPLPDELAAAQADSNPRILEELNSFLTRRFSGKEEVMQTAQRFFKDFLTRYPHLIHLSNVVFANKTIGKLPEFVLDPGFGSGEKASFYISSTLSSAMDELGIYPGHADSIKTLVAAEQN